MKITIEISVEEARMLLTQQEPSIVEEPETHEDFVEVEEDPEPEPEPEPAKPEIGRGRRGKMVDVRLSDGRWKTFDTPSTAGAFLGVPSSRITTAIRNGHRVKGFDVREHQEDEEKDHD